MQETPDFKSASIILLVEIFLLLLVGIKSKMHLFDSIGFTPVTFLISFLITGIFSVTIMLAGLIFWSYYFFISCWILNHKTKFYSILSALIYCRMPIILGSAFTILIGTDISLLGIFSIETSYIFLKILLGRIELFAVWMTVMDIIAIAIISGVGYLRSLIIVFLGDVIGLILIYFFNLKIGLY